MERIGARRSGSRWLGWAAGLILAATLVPSGDASAYDRRGRRRAVWVPPSSCDAHGRGGSCGPHGAWTGSTRRDSCDGAWRGTSHVYGRASYGRRFAGRGPCDAAPPAVCATLVRPRCGYRFYVAPRFANYVYGGRWYRPWPLVPVGATAPATDLVTEVAGPPAVPLGERAAAHDALFHGRSDDAAKGFEGLVAKDPADAAAWTGLLHARFLRSDFSGAAAALRRAAALGAVSPTERLDVAAAHADPASFRARLSGLRARVRWALEDDDARILLAYFESGLGETEDATLDAKQVLASRADDPAARALLGRPPEPPAVAAR